MIYIFLCFENIDVWKQAPVKRVIDKKAKKFEETDVFDLSFKAGKQIAMGKREKKNAKDKLLDSLEMIKNETKKKEKND